MSYSIKSISALPFTSVSPAGPRRTVLLASASTDGLVNLYDLSRLRTSSPSPTDVQAAGPVAAYSTKGTRLTCLVIAEGRRQLLVESRSDLKNGEHNSDDSLDGLEDEGEDEEDEGEEAAMYDSTAEDDDVEVEEGDEVEVEFEDDEEEAEYED